MTEREDAAGSPPPARGAPRPAVIHHSTAPTGILPSDLISDDDGVYLEDQLMVAPAGETPLEDLARLVGGSVLREIGPSGYGVLSVPQREEAAARLERDPRVRSVGLNARIYGAKSGSSGSGSGSTKGKDSSDSSTSSGSSDLSSYQWHLSDIHLTSSGTSDLSGYVVAVLDSGVAYTATSGHAQAASLAGSPITAPMDFIDGDALPLDEHWHGTHIASIIASDGSVQGVAPGVGLMPVRVLDAENAGTEAGLIDALYWAVDHGADVINLSLSFPSGYLPSYALHDALRYAHDAGVVMVAAAGNNAQDQVTWPAASPLVIAVGASDAGQALASYSNRGIQIDLLAPGGDMGEDQNADGWPDGILAETISPGAPSQTGYYFAVGTSQATAVVSGAVVQLLSDGIPAAHISLMLQYGGRGTDWTDYASGSGAGTLDLGSATDISAWLGSFSEALSAAGEVHFGAAVMPYLRREGDNVRPMALITVRDRYGNPALPGLGVAASIWQNGVRTPLTCTLAEQGQCTLSGDAVIAPEGAEEPLSWVFEVGGVVMTDAFFGSSDLAVRPEPIFFASDALEILLASLDPEILEEALLGISWEEGADGELGAVAAGYTVVNTGAGLSTSPLGLVATRQVFDGASAEDVIVDLDGSGLSTSPLGMVTLRILDGSGLSTSPLGYSTSKMLMLDGSGLSTSPLGFSSRTLLAGDGDSVMLSSGASLDGEAVWQDDGLSGAALAGTALGDVVDAGGWLTPEGYDAASLLIASGVVDAGLVASGEDLSLSGVELVPME